MPKLTKSVVESALPRDRQYTIWCSDLTGFGAFINPGGSRSYFVDYRNPDGGRRRMTIGRHGQITTEQARKLAIETMGGVVLKRDDPLLERKTRRSSLTVAGLCDDYIKALEKGLVLGRSGRPKKASTIYTDKGRIEQHIKPLLGRKLVIDLQPSDIARFIRDVTVGKTAKVEKSAKLRGKTVVEGGAGTAARTAGLLGGILSYAVSDGIIPNNPTRGVKRPADRKRERRLTAEEYRALGDTLEAREFEPWQILAGIRLLALTGCRRGEIANLKWEEVDIPGKALRLGDSKTGTSVRPLGTAAIDVLEGITRHAESPFVLHGAREPEKPFGGFPRAFERIVKASGLKGVSAHTLRHSFASVAADLDYSDSTIGAMIGHAGTTITSRYTHRLDSVLIAAANKVAGEVHRQMTGATADVVKMPRRA